MTTEVELGVAGTLVGVLGEAGRTLPESHQRELQHLDFGLPASRTGRIRF